MSDTQTIPCLELPDLPSLKIALPFGGQLSSLADFSKGPPSNCSLIQSLLLQLSPALAGMECLLKLLNFVSVVASLKGPQDIGKMIDAAGQLSTCFAFPVALPCMIVDILKLILAFLLCIIESVESLLNFRLGINFDLAGDNPTVLASLNCASHNADASANQLRQALQLIAPLLGIVNSIMGMAQGLPSQVKDVMKAIPDALSTIQSVLDGGGASAGVPGAAGPLETLEKARVKLAEIKAILDALPC